jgi:hypothetical protein
MKATQCQDARSGEVPRSSRRKWASVVGVVVGLAVSVAAFGGSAQAHFISVDSVDGCEIRDEDETRWDTERSHARNTWEARKNLTVTGAAKNDGCVDIAPDAWYTNADLEWKTANRSDVTWAGLYQNEVSADDIHLNSYWLNQMDSCQRKQVALHELGHAHGLGHSYAGQVMQPYYDLERPGVCTLQSHDRSDYHALWG